jgi:hypothetical protein
MTAPCLAQSASIASQMTAPRTAMITGRATVLIIALALAVFGSLLVLSLSTPANFSGEPRQDRSCFWADWIGPRCTR